MAENNFNNESGVVFEPSYKSDDGSIIRIPDDFNIEYIKLYPWDSSKLPIDLTNVRVTVNIFEDIFNNFVTGNISLVDSWDLATLYPLIGEEKLEISFYRQGTKEPSGSQIYDNNAYQTVKETQRYKMLFRVIKMTDRKLVRDKAQHYVLHFVSPELISNKKNKVSKAFKKKLYSDIVEDVYKTYLNNGKPIFIEPTAFEQDFVISNWSPAQAINIMASRSFPRRKGGSSYVFFETIKGFNFISLENLFEVASKEIILYQWTNWNISPANKRIADDVRNVHDYDFVDYFDILSNLQHGMYASKLLTYDLIRQRYFEYNFDYMKEFNKETHLENNKICTDNLDALGEPYMARFNLMSTNKDHDIIPWIVGKEPGILPSKLEEYVLKRQSQLQQIQNVRLAITLPGSPERQAGDILTFALPNAIGYPNKYGDEPEKYLSGKYLITAIRHRIERNVYVQDIEIVKDSFLSKIEYIDPIDIFKLPTS